MNFSQNSRKNVKNIDFKRLKGVEFAKFAAKSRKKPALGDFWGNLQKSVAKKGLFATFYANRFHFLKKSRYFI